MLNPSATLDFLVGALRFEAGIATGFPRTSIYVTKPCLPDIPTLPELGYFTFYVEQFFFSPSWQKRINPECIESNAMRMQLHVHLFERFAPLFLSHLWV